MGPFCEWAEEAEKLLQKTEARYIHRLPRGEITSRGLQKLSRQNITSLDQLRRLVPFVARQVIFEWNRQREREEKRRAPDDVDSLLFHDGAPPQWIEDQLDLLLGPKSPLKEDEKELLRVALDSPEEFLGRNGKPRQAVLGTRLGVDQKTICNQWARIRRKAAALRTSSIQAPSL